MGYELEVLAMLRIIFCGSRTWTDKPPILNTMRKLRDALGLFVVIEGEATGADTIARYSAAAEGLNVIAYPANWTGYGKRAGPVRNRLMVTDGRADAVVAFTTDLAASNGTRDMVTFARESGLPTWVFTDGAAALTEFINTINTMPMRRSP